MGLAISVGMLADLLINDEEGGEWMREDLEKLNGVLARAGLAAHIEPTETDTLSIGTYGYSGLHHLRRCAAHLQFTGKLPAPFKANEHPHSDVLYARYGAEFESENGNAAPGAFARASARRFDHLFMHSDAEGYYIPQKFERVLISGDLSYGWVGSCHALASECERIAEALELPADLLANGEDLAFQDAIVCESKPPRRRWPFFKPRAEMPPWHSYSVAAMLCAKLYTSATHSIRTGAALLFC